MDSRVDVVSYMVTIVESILIVEMIDALESKGRVESVALEVLRHGGDIWVNEDVLGEVAEHQGETADDGGQDEDVEGEDWVRSKAEEDG